MSDRGVAPLLEALQSAKLCDGAWAEFLESYSPVLYQTARACTSDDDAAADCYLHICERLCRNGFRRLLKFKPEGVASFTTWLRVVARNLCFDRHRSQSGRPRPFKAMQRLSPLEIEIYESRIVHGASQEETLHRLESRFPDVGLSELSEIEGRLQGSLSSRQQWILATRKRRELGPSLAVADEEGEPLGTDVADPRPSQETWFADHSTIRQGKTWWSLSTLKNSSSTLPMRPPGRVPAAGIALPGFRAARVGAQGMSRLLHNAS